MSTSHCDGCRSSITADGGLLVRRAGQVGPAGCREPLSDGCVLAGRGSLAHGSGLAQPRSAPEILGDVGRYNQLPEVAARMGLAVSDPRTLWKDRAVTELNAAVLHSYEMSGVRIADHHTESERFLAHVEQEQRHGRRCPADWSWIVPPAAASTTPVFHRYYDDFDASPNFRRHAG